MISQKKPHEIQQNRNFQKSPMKPNHESSMGNYHFTAAMVVSFFYFFLPQRSLTIQKRTNNEQRKQFNAWQFNFTSETNSIKTSVERKKPSKEKSILCWALKPCAARHNCLKLSFRAVQIFIEKAFWWFFFYFWECWLAVNPQ